MNLHYQHRMQVMIFICDKQSAEAPFHEPFRRDASGRLEVVNRIRPPRELKPKTKRQ